MKEIYIALAVYLVIISLVAIFVTIFDKNAAKNNARRISEKTLLLIGLLGGALAMYFAMKAFRHKTKHAKFMVGLPLMIVFHIALVVMAIVFF